MKIGDYEEPIFRRSLSNFSCCTGLMIADLKHLDYDFYFYDHLRSELDPDSHQHLVADNWNIRRSCQNERT